MPHTCSTLLLHCIDFRLEEAMEDYLATNKIVGDCDVVSIAGGVKDLVKGGPESDFIMHQFEVSHDLHSINTIVLLNHTDCGAYGGNEAFSSTEEECGQHKNDLENAKKIIQERYPELEIKLGLADIDESGQVTIKSI